MHTFQNAQSGAAITVKVLPRAKKTELVGVMEDGTFRIRIAAPPVEGAANHALIEFLSQMLNVPPSQIDIVAGEFSERKLITLVGVTPEQVDAALGRFAPATQVEAAKEKKAASPRAASPKKKPAKKPPKPKKKVAKKKK